VKVNCAALPAELLESELFGHEKGAFTGAATTRVGKFEQANLGTIFLDEIGEMKPALQAKLLHVLQDGEFTKLGSNKKIEVDVRVITATNRDLEAMLVRGQFREDLYYRLKVIEAVVPALRDRRDEIPQLTEFFLGKYSRRYNRPVPAISEELGQWFLEYDWPGNIRELENMIKRFVILQDDQLVLRELSRPRPVPLSAAMPVTSTPPPPEDFAPPPFQSPPPVASAVAGEDTAEEAGDDDDEAPLAAGQDGRRLGEVAREAALNAERTVIADTLRQVHWNRRKAAQLLGVSYKTLLNKIKETGLERP
jgi:two-component system response regulator AtoC